MTEPTDKEQCLNIADQCAATATSELAASILVDGGNGTLRQLLNDAAGAIRAGWATPQPTQAQAGAAGKAVHQFRKKHCSDWYDGLADHSDGGGPYEERTLYTAGAVPLTDEQWQRIADLTDSILTRATKDEIERVIGIKGGQHGADN